MKVELLTITQNCEDLIETAGRTCYQSTPGDPTIIQRWIKAGHESMVEHASATFRISEVSRALSHQLVRHRIASYSQQSQRYMKEEGFDYTVPPTISKDQEATAQFIDAMLILQNTYDTLIALGIPKEDAGFLLPNACHTEIVVTMNFRAMRNFFKLRLDKHAQHEIRKMANYMLSIVKQYAPNVFYDMEATE